MYIVFACLSALFAGITSILAKCGIKKTDSDIATAIRTGIVLIFSWIMVFFAGSQSTINDISFRSFLFLILSGIATGASWLCYFKALSTGDINKVVPIDKSSLILTVLFAIIFLGERTNVLIRLVCLFLISIGTLLMIEKKAVKSEEKSKSWLVFAVLSAVFAALTSILAKIGIENVESNLATAIRTCVVLIMAWFIVCIKGKGKSAFHTDKKELIFIILSGIATGASWLCYYKAIQSGDVSIVVPIDKLSILVTVAFSAMVFKEKLSKKAFIGLILITAGTIAMAVLS